MLHFATLLVGLNTEEIMPKMKTKQAAAKRFRVSGTGKIMRRHANVEHILTKKTSRRKRRLSRATTVSAADFKIVAPMLPYRKKK
jgi:large subunit ribosomal protein L35